MIAPPAPPDGRTGHATALMERFARRGRRYLWTDAFAVTNYIALADRTGDAQYLTRALDLVADVHQVLGRHREGGTRAGWISGLSEQEGAKHPTAGGLRIGKPLEERGPYEPVDAQLEWDREGQYFHYLTKWMHALDQTSRASGDLTFNCWGRELAERAHRAFVYSLADGSKRMYWKMSVDLTRPLVASMGQHDPLDGFVTYLQLQATDNPACPITSLDAAIADFASMIDPRRLATYDPLGLGGLMTDAYRLWQLGLGQEKLIDQILWAARLGLSHFVQQPERRAPAELRLAFRELGLAIGLAAIERMPPAARDFSEFLPLAGEITDFWLDPQNQRSETWRAHLDINEVMLATSLVPEGFVSILNQRLTASRG